MQSTTQHSSSLPASTMKTRHPWQLFPGQLIQYALDHLHRSSEFDQIVGFLLLDVGVETLFKVFLLLPEETTKTDMPYGARKKATEGSFHDLVRGVETAAKTAGDRLKGIDLGHVQYFHGLRNKLYHAGNGITVQGEHAEQYASIALDLLDRLLDVPLKSTLCKESRRQEQLESLRQEMEQVEQLLIAELRVLREDLRLAIEKIEPAFLMPSFELQVKNWSIEGSESMLLTDPKFFEEVTVTESVEEAPDQSNIIEIGKNGIKTMRLKSDELRSLMPSSLRRFVDRHQVDTTTAARFLMASDMTEFLLIVAAVKFTLPVVPASRLYRSAHLFLSGPPLSSPENARTDHEMMDSRLREGKKLLSEVRQVRTAIDASTA